jgi:2,3-dihydroxyphenylpropionate 1,2-dioxygenase
MHLEGADMLADGRRTREDICLNPEFDAEFLEIVTSGDLTRIDGWDPAATVERAGIGSLELHTWVAACAANRAAQGHTPKTAIYADTLEYGIGFGLIYAGEA